MMGLSKKSTIMGIEIDAREIRGVELGGSGREPDLIAYGRYPLPPGLVENGHILQIPEFGQALAAFHKAEGFVSKRVVMGVNSLDIILRIASFQKVPEDKLRNMIMFQAQDHIPVPLNELILDYLPLDEKVMDNLTYVNTLLVAAKKPLINSYIEGIKEAKLEIREIDASLLAWGRGVLRAVREEQPTLLMLYLGREICGILLYKEGHLVMARSKPTPALLAEMMNQRGTVSPEQGAEAAALLMEDIRIAVAYYYSQHSENLAHIYLTGHVLGFPGLGAAIEEESGLEVRIPEFYPRLKGREHLEMMDYAGCISLALRELED